MLCMDPVALSFFCIGAGEALLFYKIGYRHYFLNGYCMRVQVGLGVSNVVYMLLLMVAVIHNAVAA